MALSNALSNSILQPGVCTSSNRPQNPYEGQFIYETDTDALLVYNGTSWTVPSGPNIIPVGNQFATKNIVDAMLTSVNSTISTVQTTANTALSTANSANSNANNRVARSGDTMTGNLNLGSNVLYLRTSNTENAFYFNAGLNKSVLTGRTGVVIQAQVNESNFWFKDSGAAECTGGWLTSSSLKIKDNIETINEDLVSESIDRLQPVTYTFKKGFGDTEKKRLGFIAENVAKILPELVSYDDNGEPSAVSYAEFSVLAVAEIQLLRKRLSAVEEKLDELLRHEG